MSGIRSEALGRPSLKILKIWDAEYPWDVRAEKVARALTEGGHDVLMVARNRDHRPVHEQLPECQVLRFSKLPGCPAPFERATQFPAFFNPRWGRLILRGARSHGVDLLLVRDLPLAPLAIWVGRRLGVPVVLDMAENYPAMMQDLWLTKTQGPFDWIVRNPRIVRWVERWSVVRVDHILVVVEESARRLAEMGVDETRISVVGNTPPLARVLSERRPDAPQHGPTRVAYLGLIEEARGVRTLLRALAICKERRVEIEADIIGEGRDRSSLTAFAAAEGLSDSVTFHGFVPHREALGIVAGAHWGVIPHHANEAWNTTIPNKLFDYMAAGLAVVASDADPVERVVVETGCGAVFPSRDAAALADILTETAVADRSRYGEAGRQAAREVYHWERDAAHLLERISHIGSRPPAGEREPTTRDAVHVPS